MSINNDLKEMSRERMLDVKSMNPLIDDSWRRCLSLGLNPGYVPENATIKNSELKCLREKNSRIREIARPELELLFSQIAGTNFMVAFADSRGTILEAILDHDFQNSSAGKVVVPGSVWTENYKGTNALGLAVETGQTAIVYGKEHFFSKLGNISCFASPIKNHLGQTVGVIDASTDAKSRQKHTVTLVKLASVHVENRLFAADFKNHLIIAFHPRQEYLNITNVGLLAVDNDGTIVGVNDNAKMMMHGLDLSCPKLFDELFKNNFGSVIQKLKKYKKIPVKDAMGSTIFMTIQQPAKLTEYISRNVQAGYLENKITKQKNKNQQDKKIIIDDPVLKKQLRQAQKTLGMKIPVLIEGDIGTGKQETAKLLHQNVSPQKPFVAIDGNLVQGEEYQYLFFGPNGRIGYLGEECDTQKETNSATANGKFSQAANGTLYIKNFEVLSHQAQSDLSSVIDVAANQNTKPNNMYPKNIILGTTQNLDELNQNNQLNIGLVHRIAGFRMTLPPLNQRTDFEKIVKCLVEQISPQLQISKPAIQILKKHFWGGNVRQLKTTLKIAATQIKGKVIREEIKQAISHVPGQSQSPCPACMDSPLRQQKCLLIQKTWKESGGNISMVAKTLGVSRTTIYSHLT